MQLHLTGFTRTIVVGLPSATASNVSTPGSHSSLSVLGEVGGFPNCLHVPGVMPSIVWYTVPRPSWNLDYWLMKQFCIELILQCKKILFTYS